MLYTLQLDQEAADVLNTLQQTLNGVLDELSSIFAGSLDSQIKQSIQELGSLLAKVKGSGQVSLSQPNQRANIQQDSDNILGPLMDLLDGRSVSAAVLLNSCLPIQLTVMYFFKVPFSIQMVQKTKFCLYFK